MSYNGLFLHKGVLESLRDFKSETSENVVGA